MRRLFVTLVCLFYASGLWGACTNGTFVRADYGAAGSGNTATVTVNSTSGNLIAFSAWCYPNCTPTSVVMGAQTAVQAAITPGNGADSGQLGPGQGWIYYILSSTVTNASITATLTVTGSPSGIQLAYMEFSPNAGCIFQHAVDAPIGNCLASGGCGTTSIAAPTITLASSDVTSGGGDVLVNFIYTGEHLGSFNGIWSCPIYSGSGESGSCFYDTTVNGTGYVLNAGVGSFTTNATIALGHTAIRWQSTLTSFKMASSSPNACPTGVPAGITNCVFVSSAGSDSNSGATEALAWLHAPGMPNCASNCAAWSGSGGKGVILRGGDTWHFGNSSLSPYTGGKWDMDNWSGTNATCVYEGATSGCIYWGVDQTWFSGASWTRPIMSGDNPIGNPALNGTNPRVSSCAFQVGSNNNTAAIYNAEYVDNFEFSGFCTIRNPASTGPSTDIVLGYGGDGNVFETNLYFHGWSGTTAAGTSNQTISCTELGGSTQGTAQQYIVGLVVDGSDSDAALCEWGVFPRFTHFKNSIIRYTTQGVGGACHDIHDNIFEFIFNPDVATHGNVLECNDELAGSTPNVFYNNTMRHIPTGFFSPAGQVGWWFCPGAAQDFWFNNIAYDLGSNASPNFWAVAGTLQYPSCTAAGTQKMFNNTFSGALQPCYLGGSSNNAGNLLTVLNEHLMNTPFDSSSAGHTNPCVGGAGSSTNIQQTWATSTSQGYTQTGGGISDPTTCARDGSTPCSPVSGAVATVNSGTNEQAFCTTLASFGSEPAIGTDAANACKKGTTNGCTYNTTSHSVSCPAQTAVVRPTSTAWNSGAYQFNGSIPQAATPTASPSAGSFSPFVNVTPSDITAGAFICWNLTGSPGPINGATSCPAGSYRYFNPITLTVTTHIYFIAGGPGLLDSTVLDAGLFTLPTPNGTAPNYLSTTTTANVGTVAPLFNASSAVNSTAFDTSYNPSPMDCYTRLTNGTTFGGKSVGNNSFSGGSNDVMFSKAGTYVGIEQGGATFIFHLDLSGVCGRLINTGNLTGSGGIHLANGFGASRVTDNVFYTENADTQVQQSTIINDTTVNTITLVDVADGATCPGLPFPFGATHGGILSVSEDDSRFAWVLSNAGGQGTGVWLVVWDRQLGCAVENYGAVDAVTNPLGGKYWAFCKGSCGPSTTPTGSLDSFNTCTNGGNCSCWGGPSHGGQLSLDGNYFMVTQNAGTPWTQGACSGVNVATMLSIWTVGTSTTQFCNSAPGTQVGGQYCDGHESVGVNHMVSAINNVYSNRALSNTLAYTQFQTSFLTQHGYWPHPNNDDSAPWINATSNQVVSGAGSIFAPFNLVNTAYAAYPNSVNKAFTIFGHTYSCNPTNSTLWQQCSGPDWTASTSYTLNQVVTPLVNNAGGDSFQVTTAGTSGSSAPNWNQTTGGTQTDGSITWTNVNLGTGDASFACQAAIITVSQDGNWAVVPSSMFHNLGMDSTSQYRCDAFLVHIGQSNPVPATYFGLHWKIANFPPLVPSGSVRLWDSLTRWQLLNPSNGVYDFTNLDTNLLDAKMLGVDVLFALSTTPNYISSDPTNATCNYNTTANGGCGVPTDIAASCTNVNGAHNCDGKTDGTNQKWRNFIYNMATHIAGLNTATYQVPSSYEIWNEFTQQGTSGAGTCSQVGGTSWEGTCVQLVRMYSDANCILTGRGAGCTAGAMGVAAVGIFPTATVTTPSSVMTAPQSTQWGAYLLTSGALTNADVAAVHAYTQGGSCCAQPETVVTRYTTASGLLGTAGGTQPIWSTEGGWGQSVSEPDVDLQAAFVARYYILGWNAGFKRLYWYSYDSLFGTLWTSGGGLTKAGVAYGQIYNWMVGSVISTPFTATGTVWSGVLTNATGDHLVMWDTSQSCSLGNCTTANQPVASTWLAYQDMTTASVPVAVAATHQVPIGANPVIFQQSIITHGAGVNPVILGMNRGPE